MILQALFVFVAVAVSDVFWVRTVTNVSAGHRWRSGVWSTFLYAAQTVGVISYTKDHRMIVPALLGAFVGTALGVKRKGHDG